MDEYKDKCIPLNGPNIESDEYGLPKKGIPIEQPDKELEVEDINFVNQRWEPTPYPEKIMLKKLIHSTLTATGSLTGFIKFKEKEFIEDIEPTGFIKCISCNFGVKTQPGWTYKPAKTTNKGRKKKDKIRKERKRQGNGGQFDSMIAFYVQGDIKVYIIKLFRNSIIQVTGGLKEDMSDIRVAGNNLATFLSKIVNSDVKIDKLGKVMSNWKTVIDVGPNIRTNIDKLYNICKDHFGEGLSHAIINRGEQGKLELKFITPIPTKDDRTVTIMIFPSNKVNFFGGYYRKDIDRLYFRLNELLCQYKDEIFYEATDLNPTHKEVIKILKGIKFDDTKNRNPYLPNIKQPNTTLYDSSSDIESEEELDDGTESEDENEICDEVIQKITQDE